MHILGKDRHPLLARPSLLVFAITFGMTAAAFAGYVLEPIALNTTTANAMWAPAKPDVMRRLETASRVELPVPAPIILEGVVITSLQRRPAQVTTEADACEASNWRTLETGPAMRQVRGFCPIPDASVAQSPTSILNHSSSGQHLTAPRVQHNGLGTTKEPGRIDSIHATLHAT